MKKIKMEEKEVEAVKVEKKKALLVKRHINTGKGEKEEKVTKDEEVWMKIDAEVEKKKADVGKKVEKRKETQKKKTAGEWTKVDNKGFPLVIVYPSVPKKSRSQMVPDGEGFQTIKRTPKNKVKRNDSSTPEEREERVLRNNPFWIPKTAPTSSLGLETQFLSWREMFPSQRVRMMRFKRERKGLLWEGRMSQSKRKGVCPKGRVFQRKSFGCFGRGG